jgi:hypothetical protein
VSSKQAIQLFDPLCSFFIFPFYLLPLSTPAENHKLKDMADPGPQTDPMSWRLSVSEKLGMNHMLNRVGDAKLTGTENTQESICWILFLELMFCARFAPRTP